MTKCLTVVQRIYFGDFEVIAMLMVASDPVAGGRVVVRGGEATGRGRRRAREG